MTHAIEAGKRTRSILVIEEEYQLRAGLLQVLSEENWKVFFALTEDAIINVLETVAGVIFSWDGCKDLNRESILKVFGDLPVLVVKKPYTAVEMVTLAAEKIAKDQLFVGDRVVSKITPDWGTGLVVSTFPEQFYGVIFRQEEAPNGPEIALRCHFSGLRHIKD